MKKIILFLFLVGIFLTNNSVFAFYDDVSQDHEYYDAIKNLYDYNLLPHSQNFYPDDYVNIKEFHKILLTFGNAELSNDINLPFIDIDNTDQYAKYIQTSLDLGILKAQGINPYLNPNQTVSKGKALKTMFETLGVGVNYFFDKENFIFKDIKTNSKLAPIAVKALELGITEKNTEFFRLAKRITKAETADYLNKIHSYSPTAEISITLDTSYPSDNTFTQFQKDEKLDTFYNVWNAINSEYYYQEEVNPDSLIFSAIKAMVDELDDIYTIFQEPEEALEFYSSLSSEYEGIGAYLEKTDKGIVIISPIKGSPAETSGLMSGDIILEVNNENVEEESADNVAAKIKGPAGTLVKLKILREDEEIDFSIKRETILYNTVQYEILKHDNKNIAYFDIFIFGDNTYSEFYDAAEELLDKNDIDGVILDLRNNPGGYANAAINIANLFIENMSKTIVKFEFTNGDSQTFVSNGKPLLSEHPVVIIINKGSASASEIVAGALKDHEIATIIGETSFGKGSVQKLSNYQDGSLFKYTNSKWLTPENNSVDGTGIIPDITIKMENQYQEDRQIEKALEQFE